MKKRMTALLLGAALMACLLAGCGSSTMADNAMKQEIAPEAPMESPKYDYAADADSVLTSGSGASASVTNQKLIKRVTINAETDNLQDLLPQLTEKVAELGGYVESREVYNGSTYSSRRYRNADLTIRIPADKVDGFVAHVSGVSNVVSSRENID